MEVPARRRCWGWAWPTRSEGDYWRTGKREDIEARYIDPRAGASQAAGREGGTSIIDLLGEGEDLMYLRASRWNLSCERTHHRK